MKGASKVMMVAALVLVASLAIVLGLVLVLVVELYCPHLFSRRKHKELRTTTSTGTANSTADNSSQRSHNQSFVASLSSFHAQGVLNAPRSLLFPAVSSKDTVDVENQLTKAPTQTSESKNQKPFSTSPRFKVLYAEPLSPPASFQPVLKVTNHNGDASTSKNGGCEKNLVYISNPVYDNTINQTSITDTPFGTPDSSPSRLEISGSSSEDDDGGTGTTLPITPPLTPMKKLPLEACSVPLREARSLGTTASYSNSNDGDLSSSLSGSPSTSPPW